jgi:putative Mg2+ transporter-C (MgtC) family protein
MMLDHLGQSAVADDVVGLGYWPISLATTLLGVLILAVLRRAQFAMGMKEKDE